MKPLLKLDLEKVEPLTLSAYETPDFTQLAPIINGRHDFSKIKAIDLEKLYHELRLQTSIFDKAATILAQMKEGWKGSPAQLFAQRVPLVEKFTASDKLEFSPPLFALDDTKRRIMVRLNPEKIVNPLCRFLQSENVEDLQLVVDQDRPILATGDMKPWDTSKACVPVEKSHINFCVCDSTWEATEAMNLDRSPHVAAWVKNDHLGFEITYLYNGVAHKYRPDFLIKLATGEILILETKGQHSEKDRTKRAALREWLRAVNLHGGFGRWCPEPAISRHPDDIPQILARAVKPVSGEV